MCGIFGFFLSEKGEIERESIDRMQRAILSRGPDQSGLFYNSDVCLGINRLSVIDPEQGNQPIYNEDGSLVIVYNGEIYNYPALRQKLIGRGHLFRSSSDTETVLHAFEEYGPRCLEYFNGMFAFAVYDKKRRKLFLARDRLGIKPLYMTQNKRGIIFASEAKALLPFMGKTIEPNWTEISRYFAFGYIPSPGSPFSGIEKFPAGNYAFLENNSFERVAYWKPSYDGGGQVSFKEAKNTLVSLMDKAVKSELISDVPAGVFLSGGLDSSAVAAFAVKHCKSELHSFGLKFMEKSHDESSDAMDVATHLGIVHHSFTFTEEELYKSFIKVYDRLDEPFADSTVLPLLTLSEYARKYVKVVLTGWGGDEIFAGYPTYRAHKLGGLYRRLPLLFTKHIVPSLVRGLPISDKYMSFEFKARRFIRGMDLAPDIQHFIWMGYYDEESKKGLIQDEVWSRIKEEALAPVKEAVDLMEEKECISRILHLDALFFLEGNGLFQADRMTMAASLEARVPLLNKDIIDYINPLSSDIKMRGGKPKELLRQALAPYLPKHILRKPKKGFGPPTDAWIRGPFASVIEKLFSRERVNSQALFHYDEISRLIREHKMKKSNHGRNLWALLSFQLWYEKFIVGNKFEDLGIL